MVAGRARRRHPRLSGRRQKRVAGVIAGKVLIAGATGFVGGRLARALLKEGKSVRCLVRDPSRARELEAAGAELHVGDVTDAASLERAGWDVDVAYFLVHSMAGGEGFAERERSGAANFARTARREGVGRVVYLGGLGEESTSEHLRSRHETAYVLAAEGPPLTYFRAAMVVGAESESYRTLRYLVGRLPVMVAPAWLRTPTQPIGIDAVVDYLRRAPSVPESSGREVQIGGPDVLTYEEMLDRMALAMGKRRPPRLRVPLLSPWLSSLWLGLITPVDTKVARPLIEGLTTPTVVTDPAPALPFGVTPEPFDEALRRALGEENQGFRELGHG
ncbi:MAG TPA: NAD(P)H-binding protein [Solirubrobacterales bacterium]|nr:NAD(P)H-binding protein [Solirubrobacterales bacterium]